MSPPKIRVASKEFTNSIPPAISNLTADQEIVEPNEGAGPKAVRAGLQVIGGAIPLAGGILSAAAGAWSEHEQERVNNFLKHWLKMLEDEMKEKEKTILEMMARLNLHDKKTAERIESPEYQSLLKKRLSGLARKAKTSGRISEIFLPMRLHQHW